MFALTLHPLPDLKRDRPPDHSGIQRSRSNRSARRNYKEGVALPPDDQHFIAWQNSNLAVGVVELSKPESAPVLNPTGPSRSYSGDNFSCDWSGEVFDRVWSEHGCVPQEKCVSRKELREQEQVREQGE